MVLSGCSVVALALGPVRGPVGADGRGIYSVFRVGLQKGLYSSTLKRVTEVHPNRLHDCNVALGAVHGRNKDRSLTTWRGQISLKAINTTYPLLACICRGSGRQILMLEMSSSILVIIFCIPFLPNLEIEGFL